MFELMWQIITELWWLWLIVIGISLLSFSFDFLEGWLKKRTVRKWLEKHKTLEEWKKVDGKEFERITAAIFEKLGYKTKVVGGPGDRGIDVIGYKDGKKTIIQCKKRDVVSPKDILALKGAINEGEQGILVTTGRFTKEGKEIAKEKSIELIDGLKLENLWKKTRD
ncbi:MAG TPA: restriction endonuclease [Candidatus Pacearchaeota archaeon]|nr:restriction endonuclease [Candidatus Pacearchaeota archaeon]